MQSSNNVVNTFHVKGVYEVTSNSIGKNKIIKVIRGEEHVLYEVSAEIMTVLQEEPLFHQVFHGIGSYEDWLFEALSHTRSEAERTKAALDLLRNLWQTRMDTGPYLVPNLLAEFEHERLFCPRYRDHTVHQLRVLLLGLYFYCRNLVLREALRQEVQKFVGDPTPTDERLDYCFVHAWLLIAIYHDQGYVFELSDKENINRHLDRVFDQFNRFFEAPLSKYLRDFFGTILPEIRERRACSGLRLTRVFQVGSFDDLLFEPDGETSILDKIEDLINSTRLGPSGESLQKYYEMARSETPLGEGRHSYCDHGIASAVMLLRSHQELRRYVEDLVECEEKGTLAKYIPNEQIREIITILRDALIESAELVRYSAAAIAVHNIDPGIWPSDVFAGPRYNLTLESYELSLSDNPLAFLLHLCDFLQDWDRPRFALPNDTDDYIRIDQHQLIAANEREIGIRFYPTGAAASFDEVHQFNKLKHLLSICLREEDLGSLISQNAVITRPDKLSSESIDQVKAREHLERQQKYESIENQWRSYRASIVPDRQLGLEEEGRRSRRLRHFRAFLQWCESSNYDYIEPAPDEELERVYSWIRAEINDLNFVMVGSVIEGREVLSRIGAGGYGAVFKVQRQEPNAPYEALKIFHTNNFAIPELVDRFARGFNSMSTLRHSQITKVTSFMLIPRGYFMEYVEGENLADFLDNRSLRLYLAKATDCLELLIDVCEILEYAHGEGVRHRDIKPENIIMRWSEDKGRYEPVLTDFDLAWYMQAVAITAARAEIVGSYLYASPEQKKPREDPDLVHKPTVDIFSLGRLLYFVFTRQSPEEDIDLGERLCDTVRKRYREVRAESFAYELEAVYRKATRIFPSERYQSVTEFKNSLQGLLRLLGAASGTFEEKAFLLELAIRLNGTGDLKWDAKLAGEGTLKIRITEGEIEVKTSRPKGGQACLDVRISLSQLTLAALQQKSFRAARDQLNARIEKWLDQCPLGVFYRARGGTADTYSYNFRIQMPEFSLEKLDLLHRELNILKSNLTC